MGHKGAVWSCQMDNSGGIAATASGDFSVQVWDAVTGDAIYQLQHGHIVKTCAFSPNSKYLATGGHEGILRIFNLTTMKPPTGGGGKGPPPIISNDPSLKPVHEFHLDPTTKIIISKLHWINDSLVVTGGHGGKLRFWQIPSDDSARADATPIHVLETNGAEVRDMEISSSSALISLPDGRRTRVLTVAAGDTVFFFDLQTNALIQSHKMPIHFREEGGASLHPSGTKFVVGGSDLWVRVFDFQSGAELDCYKGHHGPIRCIRFSPDGSTFASGSEDGTIRLWKTDPVPE
jgi:serine-threonine kinase receptor-associated protein